VDAWVLAKAAIMGVVEGLTEFLPISSTGHLILAASLLDFTGTAVKVFDVAIQTGAMLAVIVEYRQRFAATLRGIASDATAQRFTRNVLVAFAPAVVSGLAFGGLIKTHLFHPVPVALAFIVGGIVILWVEARHRRFYGQRDLEGARHARVQSVDDMSAVDALKVGLVQCLALIPGTSRSGATIIGAMVFGFSRKAAAEFSFFLAVPTLIGAGAYSVWKERDVRARHAVRVRQRLAVHPLADPLRVEQRLHAVRVVPHRLRCAGAAERSHGLGRMARMTAITTAHH
jgi:undecaprenyl-diphosphatase